MHKFDNAKEEAYELQIAELRKSVELYEKITRHLIVEIRSLKTSTPILPAAATKSAELTTELESEKLYSTGLVTENRRLHILVKALRNKLKLAEKVVSFCQRELAVAEHDNLLSENEHLKDLLFISDFDYGGENFDDSMPISSQVSPSHHSISFQISSPSHQPVPNAELISPLRMNMQSPEGFLGDDLCFIDGNVVDVTDVGPPLSPPGTVHTIGNVTDHVADALENEQEKVDREESERGTVEVEHDLEHN